MVWGWGDFVVILGVTAEDAEDAEERRVFL
jgi:hypothetical protein